MESMASWVVKTRSSEKVRHFGGTYHLYLQGRQVNKAKNGQKLVFSPASTGFFFVLLFDHEDGDDMFLRNVGFSELSALSELHAITTRKSYSSLSPSSEKACV
jgi:hypothetical protein